MHVDKSTCDVLILAPLAIETDAVLSSMQMFGASHVTLTQTRFPALFELTLGESRLLPTRRVVLIRLNRQGVLNAAVDTCLALQLYEPAVVVSFGIAGSLNAEDAPIGSSIFATSLFYYEPSKDQQDAKGSSIVASRMDPISVDVSLLNSFRQAAGSRYRSADGPLASGEKLLADVGSTDRKRILAANGKALAVDMEAAGVGRAVEVHAPTARFLVVKGISDLADPAKNVVSPEEQRRNRQLAADNAGALLAEVVCGAHLGHRRLLRSSTGSTSLAEAKKVKKIVERHGFQVDTDALHRVLENRPGRIPAYFHWRQYHEGLNWIDFRVVAAMADLPHDMFEPILLVTDLTNGLNTSWREVLSKCIGVLPITDGELKERLDEIAEAARSQGLTDSLQEEVTAELTILQHTGLPSVTLAWLRYMLGQAQHRRMIVFTWSEYAHKWRALDWFNGALSARISWGTVSIGGVSKKTDAPNCDIYIDPDLCQLSHWFSTHPNENDQRELLVNLSALAPAGHELWGNYDDLTVGRTLLLEALRQRLSSR